MTKFSTLFFVTLLSTTATHALPSDIASNMQHMCETDSPFVQRAIMNELREQYPDYEVEIIANWPAICQTVEAKEAKAEAEKKVEATNISAAIPSITGFSGQLEAGIGIQSGNTDSTELNFKAGGEQEMENWRHHFAAAAYNSKEEGVRTDEEYRIALGSDWKFNERDYLYAQINYVNDRYAGYNYRISESIGVGRRWIDDDTYLLDTRIGPGMRHTKFTTGDKEDSWIILGGLQAGWNVNDHVELGEDASVEYSPDGTIINSDTWLKTKLTDTLGFKAAFGVEHKTQTPVGVEKTDTRTTAGVVYDF